MRSKRSATARRSGHGCVLYRGKVFVMGGGPQVGGGVKSAINESFSLA